MKTILIILATSIIPISLIASDFGETNQTKLVHYIEPSEIPKNQTKVSQTNEDAEDIANKLWNKTIKLDPNVFLNKDIKTSQTQFNAVIVQEHILTQAEVNYVSWADLKINVARWYNNGAHFSVKKDGAVCTGSVTIDASINETPAQIAAKINNKDINLNLTYWNNKEVNPYLAEIRSIIVNEKLLTKIEASLITRITKPIKITGDSYIPVSFVFDDGKTTAIANNHLSVNDDGKDASQIAAEVQGKTFWLKTNTVGKYADSDSIFNQLENIWTYQYGVNNLDAESISLPHLKLAKDNKNVSSQVLKDGQIAKVTFDLQCLPNAYLAYGPNNDGNFLQAYVNLTPAMIEALQTYFPNHSSKDDLYYFYELLDGSYMSPNNRLSKNMGFFGGSLDKPSDILYEESDTSKTGIARFENLLYSTVMQSKDYLSIWFWWEYQTTYWTSQYTTIGCACW